MNHETEKKKKKKRKSDAEQQFEFCEVCRLHHNQGRRHMYFPNHKSSLSALLSRFQSKLSDVKFFLKTPMPLRPEHAQQNRLWCVFCNCDILELDSSFACGKAIEHLASEEHWKRVKGFMWKYRGGMDRVDLFRIAEGDFAKWEKRCKSMKTEAAKAESVGPVVGPSNNIHNKLHADNINSFHKNNLNSLNINITNGVLPLQSYTNEKVQVSCPVLSYVSEADSTLNCMPGGKQVVIEESLKNSTGCMDSSLNSHVGFLESVNPGGKIANGESRSLNMVNLKKISYSSQEASEGNVHTGAPPPWFSSVEANQHGLMQKPELNNLVVTKGGKSSKLNPKRVGAAWAERRKLELELERRGELVTSSYDANWLPNFGGVWQSGTRKNSRKEFQMENKASRNLEGQSERALPLQPYISKRMRGEKRE